MRFGRFNKFLGIGLTAGLVVASLAAVFAVPAVAGEMEWTLENTPSWEDMVILPGSDILDYDIGGDGDIIYAVLEVDESCVDVGDATNDFALVKSDDGGVTWTDITGNVTDAANLPTIPVANLTSLVAVSVAPDDEDWVAVAGYQGPGVVRVVASKDGGDNFSYAGDMVDNSSIPNTTMIGASTVFDLDVSIEVDNIHNIAVAGINNFGDGCIFRLKAGTWLTGSWADTSDIIAPTNYTGWMENDGVIACEFSPNFDLDDSIVCLCIEDQIPYMQSGIWESNGDWNTEGGFSAPVEITADGDILMTQPYLRCAGLSLPADYDGSDSNARAVFVYVNAYNVTTKLVGGCLFRIDNADMSPVCGPSGNPLLASIDVHGDADTGKLMIGEYIQWDNDGPDEGQPIEADCCAGVRVWHTEELDFCCPQWDGACKDPSGPYLALVMYTPDGEKAYATTSGTMDDEYFGGFVDGVSGLIPFVGTTGTPLDESAFSVSRDNGISFNQIGLIDTDIDALSDVAVCPDCSVIYLATISEEILDHGVMSGNYPCVADDCGTDSAQGYCNCDSAWRSFDNGDTWERVFHGDWSMEGDDWVLLRLPCDTLEDCCDQDPTSPSGTVYLGIWDSDQMFYSRDCGQCWNETQDTKINIRDFAVESENTVYIVNLDGEFSMSTQYGRRWTDAVDTGLDTGHSITSCCEQGFIVIGGFGDDAVAWSDDGGESWNTTDDLPGQSYQRVHVACDPVCENVIYAALCSAPNVGGIYRTDITDGSWDDLNAKAFPYYGIVVAREGTLYAASYAIFADTSQPCEDRVNNSAVGFSGLYYSGVARNLDPCETACCGTEDWDYLICGMGGNSSWDCGDKENFTAEPTALKICGCLTMDTNSILWAIDTDEVRC